MTLRELLQSVDAEAYASIPLYEELLNTKPEYGSDNRILVKVLNGEIAVSNVHVGSLGDIVACPYRCGSRPASDEDAVAGCDYQRDVA